MSSYSPRSFSRRAAFVLAFVGALATARADAPVAAAGATAHVGQRDGLSVDVAVQGPATMKTPLQVACVFEYVAGDLTSPPALPAALNGMRHLDDALHGLITELRKSGRFRGRALETLLVVPPKGAIAAERLLLVGLGDRKAFTPALMRDVGSVGMREALRLGVAGYAHASDLKDAGISSPTREVAAAVLGGALAALATERYLHDQAAAPAPSVHALTLLAGPAFFGDTTAASHAVVEAKP